MRLADAANTYACKLDICYGVGVAMDTYFRSLQSLINLFAKAATFTPITVDGKIGAGTIAAAQRIAHYILPNSASAARGANLLTLAATKEMLAQNYAQAITLLQAQVAYMNTVGMALTPSTPPTAQGTPSSALTPAADDKLVMPPPPPSSKLPWIIGGLAIAAALVGGYFIVYGKPSDAEGE